MNVIIPFKDLDQDVRQALKTKCLREGKTLQQVGSELLKAVISGKPIYQTQQKEERP